MKGIGTGNIASACGGFSALRGIEQGTGPKFALSGTDDTGGEIARAWRGGACGPSLPLGSPYRTFGWLFPCPCTSEPFSRPCEAPRRKNGQGCPSGHPKGLALSILPDGSRGERENGDGGHRDNCTLVGLSANLRDYLGIASYVFVVQKRLAGQAPHPLETAWPDRRNRPMKSAPSGSNVG